MADLAIKGGEVVTPSGHKLTNVWLKGNKISALGDHLEGDWRVIDAAGLLITPGLFDLQVNGDPDCNLWADPTDSELNKLGSNLLKHGVTSFLPTLITDEVGHLKKNMRVLNEFGLGLDKAKTGSASMLGLHLEGPFLSPEKPGVHPRNHILPLSAGSADSLVNGISKVSLMTLAPETDMEGKAIELLVKKGVHVALGHSNATFEEAQKAFSAGVKLMTHTFNALPALKHRDPGAIAAAMLDDEVTCCVIADGLHVDPPVVKLLVRIKGVDKVILVSDAAHIGTTGGGLVGSSITLDQAVKNIVDWGIATFAEAIKMASYNPARALGFTEIGELAAGKAADVVLWDRKTLTVKHVVKAGQLVF